MKQRNRPSRPQQQQQRLRLHPLAFSLICAGVAPAMAQVVLPGGFMPAPGSGVTMSQTGNVMNIRQPMQRGIVNWQTFSIGAGGTVDIAQPSTRAVLLNRVVGDGLSIQASRIDGTLKTSLIGNPGLPGGSVFLINPSGIVFGRGASVNVGGLVASTLDIADDKFMPAGSQDKAFGRNEGLLFMGPSGSMAQVKVEGGASITASPGGTIALLGGVVRNEGEINVARGSVGLVSASKVTLNLDFDGDGLTTFKIPADGQTTFKLAQLQQEDPTAVAQLAHSGKVAADGGRVVLMAAAANVDARQLVVSQTGVIQARSLSSRNGEIVLDTGTSANDTSEMRLGGTLDVSGSAAGVAGGSVTARGDHIRLAGLGVDASGSSGGTVSVKAVGALNMAPDATISADATGANGTGGTVALDAARTHVSGAISARGAGSGAGGTIGTSGGALQVSASARIDAAGGASGVNGKWNVAARSDLNVDEAVPAYDAAGYGNFAGGTHVSAKAVGDALGRASDVTLSTGSVEGETHDVVFQDNVALLKSQGRDARLTVDSLRDVRMNTGASIGSTAGALHVDFDANAGNNELGGAVQLDGATIATNGGNIRFYGQGKADTGYAVGGVASVDGSPYSGRAGITVTDSALSTCAAGAGAACGGTGAITLRGQGVSRETGEDPNYRISADGVVVLGSDLRTGAGSIAIDGKGGIRANGVRLGSTDNQGTTLRTGTGDVNITGTSRSWTPDDPAAVYASRLATSTLSAPDVTMANTAGVSMGAVTIAAGGRVGIDGTGSDIQGLLASSAFVTSAAAANGGTGIGFGPGDGVAISGGSISAGKGRDVSISGTAGGNGFVVNNGGAVVQGQDASAVQVTMEAGETVRAEGGRISLDGRGGDVRVARVSSRFEGPGLAPANAGAAVLDVSSTTGAGGTVSITGRNVLVDDVYDTLPTIDAGGAGQAGTIGIQASKTIAIGGDASLRADANSASGNGGTVRVIAGDTLRAYGSLSARGGAAGGNGGSIETSAPHFALQGLRVDASAPVGLAGTWTIDPFNVTIAHGTGPGSLTGNPFVPMANSTVQDGDINAALDAGTSVTITTGTGGNAVDGNINFDTLAAIQRTTGGAPVTFQLDAAHNINGGATNTLQSADGALNVVFNAGVGGQGGAINFGGTINTNGGSVTMTADAGASSGAAIALNGAQIDTRTTAAGDAGPGGAVQLSGRRTLPGTIVNTVPTVDLTGVSIQSSTGDVSISGIGQHGDGVRIQNGTAPSRILTTSGDVDIVGIGASYTYSQSALSVQSVEITGATVIRSIDGNIGVRGLVTPGPLDAPSGGVLLAGTTLLTTLGVGNIDIAGESQANGAGVNVGTGARVNGNNNVVLRASNNGSTDALVLGGNVRAGNVLNLRPGGVDAAGNAVDRTANAITLGGAAATGFAVSAAEFARLDAPTIVAGSNVHAGDIDVVGPLSVPAALTLQNGAGGNIRLGGAVTAAKLGLVSRGDITQTAGAPITAGTLLARSTGGSVLLDQAPNNVSADTLGGGAAGAFRYVDVDTVQLGSVSVTGFDAAGNAPQVVSATSMAADTVFVRTLSGDLLLGTGVSSVNGVDLVAGARFQNPGGYAITGAPWRVWADTWLGETRGGLQGSGLYPNLYHCAYSGLCAVSIPAGANHFIYAQQPLATVVIGNASRPFGYPNPLFSYGIGGLILGDTGAGFAGFLFSPALRSSRQGAYPINGIFTSAEGYAVNVVPGSLFVAGLPALPRPDTLRDLPATWVYDRNIGPPPICFATGTLDGDRAAQGGDVLAREWSRVRSRPNLSSCVDTEKRNGCADF